MRDRTVDWYPGDRGRNLASPSSRCGPLPTVLACVLPLMLLGVIVGCGGSEPSPSTPIPAASPAPPPPPPPPAPAPSSPSTETEPGDPPVEGTPPGENEPTGENPPEGGDTPDGEPSDTDESSQPTEETSTRPEEITDWKADDYLTAMADEDPKLVEAVEHLGRQVGQTKDAVPLCKDVEVDRVSVL